MLKLSRRVFLLALLSIFLTFGCSGGSGTTSTTSSYFPVVVVSDVHFDPFYDPSLFPALVAADVSEWDRIFKTSSILTPSAWGNDTNYPLLILALSSIRQNLGTSPLVIYTGDTLAHKFAEKFYGLYGSQDVTAMQAFADKTVAFFTAQLRLSAGYLPVMFVVGNNDSYLDTGPDSTFLANTAELFYIKFLTGTVDHEAFLDTYMKGGYYSAEPPGTNLVVIGLNTVLMANSYPTGDTGPAVAAELAWFDSKLASAKAAGKKVWLLMHVPPGANITATAQLVDDKGHLTNATMMLKPDYQASLLQILAKYPGLIAMTLAGHTHLDEYRIMSPSDVLEITPGISPRSGNNPAYKIFTVSRDSLKPTDYSSLNYDLATKPGQFTSYYTFSAAYSAQGLLNDALAQLFPTLVTDPVKQTLYRGAYYLGHNSATSSTDIYFNPITNLNWPVYWCGAGKMGQQEFIDCVNAY